mmetsp:Transcript_7722/g.22835  ORF Transcript_7722/g.22835 Transcript_7722/m.22835 type:complete len:249 (+) Transcript_7722:2376-3122(+)
MRFSDTLRLVRDFACPRCCMKLVTGERLSPALAAEAHEVRSRDCTDFDCARHSPMWSSISAVKQFQPRSTVRRVLLPRTSEMQSRTRSKVLPMPVPRPVSASETLSRAPCARIARQRSSWAFIFSGTPPRSRRLRFSAPPSLAKSLSDRRPTMPGWPACRHRCRLNSCSVSTDGPATSSRMSSVSACSDREQLPARLTSSTPWPRITATATARSASARAFPAARIRFEWPVTKGLGDGTSRLLWHARR